MPQPGHLLVDLRGAVRLHLRYMPSAGFLRAFAPSLTSPRPARSLPREGMELAVEHEVSTNGIEAHGPGASRRRSQ